MHLGLDGLDFASTDSFPEPPQSPDPADADPFFPAFDTFGLLLNPPFPYRTNPPSQPIFDSLPFHGSLLGYDGRSDFSRSVLAGYTLRWQHAALDEYLR